MVTRSPKIILSLVGTGALLMLFGIAFAGEDEAKARWEAAYEKYYDANDGVETTSADFKKSASLAELLNLAESQNPRLRVAMDRWKAALEQVGQSNSLPDPKFSYAYFIEPVETRVGAQRQKFGVSQTIPMFGKLGLREEVGVQTVNAASAQFEAVRLELRYSITQIWNDYYYLNRAIKVAEENMNLLGNLERVALAQYTAGKAPHSAIIRAQVELGRLEDQLLTLQDQRGPLSAALNAKINRPEQELIAWPDSIIVTDVQLSKEELRIAVVNNNPQLASLSYLRERDAGAVRLAGKNSLPDLTLGIDYIDTKKAIYGDFPDSGKDAVVVMATVNIPIWSGRTSAEKSQATAKLSATGNEYIHLKNQLLASFEQAYFELKNTKRRAELYAFTLLPKARQSLAVASNAFTTGEVDFLELIDAQRTLLEFELAYERALADHSTKRAHLEQIVGSELNALEKAKE